MNRKERRRLERQGKLYKAEPAYRIKSENAPLNRAERQAMLHEIHQQCLAADKEFALDIDTVYLWTLHTKYGWGPKRLKRFYVQAFAEHLRMRDFYEIDDLYPERHKLKEKGIDIEAWYSELFDEQGNFRQSGEVNS